MSIAAPKNPNYCATVVALKDFVDLPNCDNVKAALIFGNSVIVGKDAQASDVGLFFPVETQLSKEFLSNNNLLRKSAQTAECTNSDPAASGFFEQHGRVKAIKFRGHKSEGFFLNLNCLSYLGAYLGDFSVGVSFDAIGDHSICQKYVPKMNPARQREARGRLPRLEDAIVENQFRFHFDTENLRRNVHKIQPEDFISISAKWHGTSVVVSKSLVKNKLAWYEKLLKKIAVRIEESSYGLVYSSRRVIKGVNGEARQVKSFYTSDVWGAVAQEVENKIPDGFTLYGEIVGYTPDGAAIQKGYHYGCVGSGHRFLVYRVTYTNPSGYVVELPWLQMQEFCQKWGLEMVKTLYYGRASEWVSFHQGDIFEWQKELLQRLEATYVTDEMCAENGGKVPEEGIVVSVERLNSRDSYKCKNWKFLEFETKQLDTGQADIEMEQSLEQDFSDDWKSVAC
jgi:hypothetical protein